MVAGEHDSRPTCLSNRKHTHTIQNHVLHYLGCIEICERDSFFEVQNDLYEVEVKHVYNRLLRESKGQQEYRGLTETENKTKVRKQAEERVKKQVEQWRNACETEIRRIEYLRTLLAKDKEAQQLVRDLESSAIKWKASTEYSTNLPRVEAWRDQHLKSTSGKAVEPTNPEDLAARGPKSIALGGGLGQVQSATSGIRTEPSSGGLPTPADNLLSLGKEGYTPQKSLNRTQGNPKEYEPEKDFNMHIIEYEEVETEEGNEKGQPIRVKRHPDKKIKIDEILGKPEPKPDPKANPLHKDKAEGILRYIHLPANNMVWVEEAIARYYGEDRPDYDGVYRELDEIDRTQTYMILRPQFWRGQQHGGRSAPPHARHMRALCDTVSSNPKSVDHSPKNIVLFMPYLHWETDRQREKFALEIENITEKWKKEKKAREEESKKARRDRRKDLPKIVFKPWPPENGKGTTKQNKSAFSQISRGNRQTPDKTPSPNGPDVNIDVTHHDTRSYRRRKWAWLWLHDQKPLRPTLPQSGSRIGSIPTLVKAMGFGVKKGLPVKDGRVISQSCLGQFLIDAARLYEEMVNYRDKKLLQKYLHHELPLHPRRTLDQSYYWTLNTTKNRDRDQVVYRGTKSGNFHEYDPWKGEWPEHKEQEIIPEKGCDECRANIRNISRVTMVDQLWMWILDEQTVITCFPKRYGANKQETDASSVHKCIRTRLQNARQNHIRSVFDLALVIFDECSNTLFDRTKTRDRQPQVMDIFSEAISNVTNKQTAAFDRLYRWTNTAAKVYRSKGKVDPEAISELHVPLLDIYPEGILQREIKDIIEELDIMIDINRNQEKVLRDFIMHVEHILDPQGIYGFQHRRRKVKVMMHDNLQSSIRRDDKGKGTERRGNTSSHYPSDATEHSTSPSSNHATEEDANKNDGKDDKHQTYDWFKVNADELLAKVNKRIEDLAVLKRTAQSTSSSLTDFLALKQQQASVVQAWQSVKQSEEAVSQGRAIMMFTVVTIFFLPLSFMASVFGMNASEFGQGNVKLIHEFKYMFPISFLIIIPIFILAFSTWIRALIWFIYKYTVTVALVKTGLYSNWLRFGLTSRTLLDSAAKETEKLKNEVRAQRRQKKRDERKEEDEKWEKSHGVSLESSSTIEYRGNLTIPALDPGSFP